CGARSCLRERCLTYVFFFSSRRRHTRLVSDWSSDVCSSDLRPPPQPWRASTGRPYGDGAPPCRPHPPPAPVAKCGKNGNGVEVEIGRASCRERGEISGDGVSLKKKRKGKREGGECEERRAGT